MRVTSTSDKKAQYLKILIFGHPGAGKTRFTGTAPQPLILDIEGGTLSLAGKDLMRVKIDSYKDIIDVYNVLVSPAKIKEAVEKKHFAYAPKSIIIDSGTELHRLVVDCVAKENGRELPQKGDWQIIQDRMRKLIISFRDLPFHFIITALAEESKDDATGYILQRPSFSGQMPRTIAAQMDLVLYITIQQGKDGEDNKRVCLTETTQSVYAKVREIEGVSDVPKLIIPDFATIYNAIYGGKK